MLVNILLDTLLIDTLELITCTSSYNVLSNYQNQTGNPFHGVIVLNCALDNFYG